MKKLLLGAFVMIIGVAVIAAPVFAAESCTLTSVLGNSACDKDGKKLHDISDKNPLKKGEFNCSCDDGQGSGVNDILKLVVNIMSIGVGILGVIGITVVGVQYLTAGGNEEQTRKSKRRMLEIVIGLVAYALVYALLTWLLPEFN